MPTHPIITNYQVDLLSAFKTLTFTFKLTSNNQHKQLTPKRQQCSGAHSLCDVVNKVDLNECEHDVLGRAYDAACEETAHGSDQRWRRQRPPRVDHHLVVSCELQKKESFKRLQQEI